MNIRLTPRRLGRASLIRYSMTRAQARKIRRGAGQSLTGYIKVTSGSPEEKFFRSVNIRTDTKRGYGVVTSQRIPNAIANVNKRGQKWQSAHVLAYYFKTGRRPRKGLVVDHINSNIEDLRRGNLQAITSEQNLAKTLPSRRASGWKRAQRTIKANYGVTLQQLRKRTLIETRGKNALSNIAKKSEATKRRRGLKKAINAKISATKTGSSKTRSAASKGWETRRKNYTAAQIASMARGGLSKKEFSARVSKQTSTVWAQRTKAQRRAIALKGVRNRAKKLKYNKN